MNEYFSKKQLYELYKSQRDCIINSMFEDLSDLKYVGEKSNDDGLINDKSAQIYEDICGLIEQCMNILKYI